MNERSALPEVGIIGVCAASRCQHPTRPVELKGKLK